MNILLCCAAGMSTSLLVSKMKKAAVQQGLDCKIWAVPVDIVSKHIDQADILLIGPQVRFMFPEFKKLGEQKGIPVEVIDTVHYGTFNAKEVFRLAQQMYTLKTKG
ncbi:PTS sugar transporter subunit IIB [Neobacillus cucumis]|uniref:PTS sugar transporter subunit IIB n=1 Tax=Neobacillus cucumis TaxID=1740721 RepID=UPI0028534DFF|nr:PTS sugar transporter subunit IIB [Neobacillus cucumis]MDR4949014.1 PTS sugar transporter subunit IIB [Neobacillus cucumis]